MLPLSPAPAIRGIRAPNPQQGYVKVASGSRLLAARRLLRRRKRGMWRFRVSVGDG